MILMQVGEAAAVSEANSIKDALEQADQAVDLILLDIHLPGINGIDGLKPLSEKYSKVPIIVLSASSDPSSIRQAKQFGAAGFMNKAALAEEIVASITSVLEGNTCFPDEIANEDSLQEANASLSSALTPRQIEVLIHLCEGKPNKLIARALNMSENTVRVHVSAILNTLGASNRTEAIFIAQREGITA